VSESLVKGILVLKVKFGLDMTEEVQDMENAAV
jgi:hypothetical protein